MLYQVLFGHIGYHNSMAINIAIATGNSCMAVSQYPVPVAVHIPEVSE